MTSNIGSQYIMESRTEDQEKNRELILNTLKNYFRPEFLNRVDEIIIFNFLKEEQIKGIVKIQIRNLNKILAEHKIKIEMSEDAMEFLAKNGFDPDYGARPLKRAIQNFIQNPLSLKILENEFIDEDLIKVDINKHDKLVFKKIGSITKLEG